MTQPLIEVLGGPIEAPLEHAEPDLIEGILPARDGVVLTGETNVGKSLVTLELVSAALSGTPLWGQVAVRQVERAVYILAEHHADKLRQLWQVTKLQAPPRSLWVVGPEKLQDRALVVRGERQPAIVHRVRELVKGAQLAVFDPLGAFVAGEKAENDNTVMRTVIQTIFDICHEAGAAVIIPAHGGKDAIVDGRFAKRQTYRTRGGSAIEDAATNVFYLEHDKGDQYTLRRRKYKGTETPPTYHLLRDPETKTHTLYGRREAR